MYDAIIDHLFTHLDKKGKTLNANRVLIKEKLSDIYFRMQCRNRVSCKYDPALGIAEKHVKINERKFTKTTTSEDILKDIYSLGFLNYNRSDSSVKYGIHRPAHAKNNDHTNT
jgi:hypothetical protein